MIRYILISECHTENEIKARDPIRCRECGHRIMYKKRTRRSIFSSLWLLSLFTKFMQHFTNNKFEKIFYEEGMKLIFYLEFLVMVYLVKKVHFNILGVTCTNYTLFLSNLCSGFLNIFQWLCSMEDECTRFIHGSCPSASFICKCANLLITWAKNGDNRCCLWLSTWRTSSLQNNKCREMELLTDYLVV